MYDFNSFLLFHIAIPFSFDLHGQFSLILPPAFQFLSHLFTCFYLTNLRVYKATFLTVKRVYLLIIPPTVLSLASLVLKLFYLFLSFPRIRCFISLSFTQQYYTSINLHPLVCTVFYFYLTDPVCFLQFLLQPSFPSQSPESYIFNVHNSLSYFPRSKTQLLVYFLLPHIYFHSFRHSSLLCATYDPFSHIPSYSLPLSSHLRDLYL